MVLATISPDLHTEGHRENDRNGESAGQCEVTHISQLTMGQRSSSPQRENTISPLNTAQTTPLKASEQKKRTLPNPCVVLITGCSSGVGLALAVLLGKDAEKRFRVYATMRNMAKKGPLEEAAKDCLDDTLFIRALDVCSEESVNEVVQEVQEKESKIDVVGESCDHVKKTTPLDISL